MSQIACLALIATWSDGLQQVLPQRVHFQGYNKFFELATSDYIMWFNKSTTYFKQIFSNEFVISNQATILVQIIDN